MKLFSFVIIGIILINFSAYGHTLEQTTDSLIKILDQTIRDKQKYIDKKVASIAELKDSLQNTPSSRKKCDILGDLFDAYKSYQLDSAYAVALRRAELARNINNDSLVVKAKMNMVEVLAMTGMYSTSLEMLNHNRQKIKKYGFQAYYYHLYHSIYTQLTENTLSEQHQKYYKELTYRYKDSILSVHSPDDIGYHLVNGPKMVMDGNYNAALKYMLDMYNNRQMNTHQRAITAYIISDIYHHLGEEQLEKKYLIISAIDDTRGAVKEYISLRKLATLIYKDGEIERSYKYMMCAMEDAIFCNARLRTLEISQMLLIINGSYDQEAKAAHDRLVFLVILISIFLLVLIVSIIYIYKQLKALAIARRTLKTVNENLKQVNEDLNKLNRQLFEASHVKEEYIGYLFNMCSAYIDKLEEFRKTANRKLKVGQVNELYKLTLSTSLINDELKEFYRNFDTVFLNLYPNFVSEFNSLLNPDEHIIPKEGELLTPELRIFALVRLGINDSVKIAGFLHYSAQTVYNYRLKVRNKALIAKESFPDAVRQIGQFKIK